MPTQYGKGTLLGCAFRPRGEERALGRKVNPGAGNLGDLGQFDSFGSRRTSRSVVTFSRYRGQISESMRGVSQPTRPKSNHFRTALVLSLKSIISIWSGAAFASSAQSAMSLQ